MKNNSSSSLRGTRPFRSLFDVFVSPRVKTRRKLAGRNESLPSVDERSNNDQEVHLAFDKW